MNISANYCKKISPHIWMILGENKSKFPSGNALFINLNEKKVLIDTNPGEQHISNSLKTQFGLSISDITDIILTHTHLDHALGLASIFEQSNAKIYAHPDSLQRCEKKARVGLYAGIQKDQIHHFEAFGSSLGFQDRSYPSNKKFPLHDNETILYDEVSIFAHETNAHCLHMLDYEIKDGKIDIVLSCDYDFTPVPWYGVPQRGLAVQSFKSATKDLIKRNADYIVSSHRINPIPLKNQKEELDRYLHIIDSRTKRAIDLLPSNKFIKLKDIEDFVYPVKKMGEQYSEDYKICAKTWDNWILLSHLEEAWRLGKIECIESDGDVFLEKCIEADSYLPNEVNELLVNGWAEKTLHEEMPFPLPINSIWKK